MPQRFLKPGIVSSKKWDGLSWIAQSFYIRLITLVDDFGRHLADPVLLKSQCFPLREDIRASQVLSLCHDLAEVQLAIFYKVDGKDYVQLTNWTERVRWETSQFPAPNNPKAQLLHKSVLGDLPTQKLSKPQRTAARRSEPQPPTSTSKPNVLNLIPTSTPTPKAGERLHGIPVSVEEVIEFGKVCMPKPVSEDRCREFWAHYEGQARTNADGALFWITSSPSGEIIVTNWKVKLPQFGLKDENDRTTNRQRPDRNIGTCNEGNHAKYGNVGKVVKP